MKIENKITSIYCFAHDPAAPERGFAWHVDYVEITTYSDGTKKIGDPKQCNMARAAELGLDFPVAFGIVDTATAAERDRVVADNQRLESERDDALQKLQDATAAYTALRAQLPDIVKAALQQGAQAGAAAVQSQVDAAVAEAEAAAAEPGEQEADKTPWWRKLWPF